MQKNIFTALFLCAATISHAQKPILQQAGYIGIALRSISFGYDARFRNSGAKPDFSLGGGLDLPTSYNSSNPVLGVKAHGSMLLGKPTSSFEMGINLNLSSPAYFLGFVQTTPPPQGAADFFIGYRLQPKNKHFILQIQHSLIGIASKWHYLSPYYGYYGTIPDLFVYSPYMPIQTPYGKTSDWTRTFAIKIGCNINTVANEGDAPPAAYEAPTGAGPDLQHALTGDLHLAPFLTRIGAAYDVRWRRPNQVDYALDLGLGGGQGSYFHYQLLAVFGEGKGAMEAGLGGINLSFPNSTTTYTAIGIPIGFRYQPRKGFYFRASMTTLKLLTQQKSDTVFDTMDLGTSFGYSF
jgi:hypothetical protein